MNILLAIARDKEYILSIIQDNTLFLYNKLHILRIKDGRHKAYGKMSSARLSGENSSRVAGAAFIKNIKSARPFKARYSWF